MTPAFVSVDELEHELEGSGSAPAPVLVDVRRSLGRDRGHHAYLEGHLPGAVFVDLDDDLAAPASLREGRHPLPSPQRFASVLGARGIAPNDRVVAYDDERGVIAARLVWMLRAIGQDAALLSGGIAAWGGPLERGEVTRPPVTRSPIPWPTDRLVDADDVAALAVTDGAVVLDARDPERFRGEREPFDARAGHVPGAHNLPTAELLDEDGRLRDTAAVRARAERVGALAADDVVAYCGSGVTACFDLLALETVGVRGRLYPGSWSAWSGDPSRPVATGA